MYNEMMDTIGLVNTVDPELAAAMDRELNRQRQNIELIASENIVSPAVMAAMGSILTNKYAEGLPGKRYYGGCVYVDEVENIAIERACKLFGAKYANVQPHSGAQANLAVYFALLDLGDTVMGMDLSQGGHLTHGSPVNMSGKNYNFVSYGVNADGVIDYAELEKQVKKVRPKLIVAGASAYPRAIDFEKIAEIAHGYGAYLMVDMAHIAGLVAGGYHQSPVPYADVVTTTTHKTLRGPRGGLIRLTVSKQFIRFQVNRIFQGFSRYLHTTVQQSGLYKFTGRIAIEIEAGPQDLYIYLSRLYDKRLFRIFRHLEICFSLQRDQPSVIGKLIRISQFSFRIQPNHRSVRQREPAFASFCRNQLVLHDDIRSGMLLPTADTITDSQQKQQDGSNPRPTQNHR